MLISLLWTDTRTAHLLTLSIHHSIKNTLEEIVQQIIWTHYYFTHSITLTNCWSNESHSTMAVSQIYNTALSCIHGQCFSSGLFTINANCKFPSPALKCENPHTLGSHLKNDKWFCVYTLWAKNLQELQPHHLAYYLKNTCLPNLNDSFPLKVPTIQLLACCLALRRCGKKYPLWG